ncbi:RlpA-like double-psi beta-barrel domain-containing protein [Aspergillus mulundensis]|uniref:Allergen Asp f 7 n=1 Tax=Aspergillus mulundensis TaxID=1810919 RepID=A0A3D8QC33_9EURO|nr:hypothetical protein DSM5745_10986 [Aspergillus mulundensis]RDW59291.1 hypothetical protein DSM5745_10986 [Aspergillus mulundensis]
MAPLIKSLALAATALAALTAAAPSHGHRHHHKRGEEVTVWKTVTTVVWTTVDVTTTITAGQEAPPTTIVESTVEEATAPAEPENEHEPETTSSYVAPSTTSSTSTAKPTSTAEPEVPSVDANVQVPEPTTTSTTVSTEAPAPTTQSTTIVAAPIVAVETSSEEPEPAATSYASSGSSSSSSSGSSGSSGPCSSESPCTGQITFYDTATSASAPSSCGTTNDGSSENVLALPVGIMKDSDCGRTVTIKYGGKTSTGTVVDKCMGCDDTSIDLSRHFFSELASFDAGRLFGVEWWLD